MQFADFLNVAILVGVGYAVKLLLDLKSSMDAKSKKDEQVMQELKASLQKKPDATIAKGGDGGEEGSGR